MEVSALLMVAAAKADGDMVQEQKEKILSLYQSEFHLTQKEASELMIYSVHLLGDGEEVNSKVDKVLAPVLPDFTESQIGSAIKLIKESAGQGNEASAFVTSVEKAFSATQNSNTNSWG